MDSIKKNNANGMKACYRDIGGAKGAAIYNETRRRRVSKTLAYLWRALRASLSWQIITTPRLGAAGIGAAHMGINSAPRRERQPRITAHPASARAWLNALSLAMASGMARKACALVPAAKTLQQSRENDNAAPGLQHIANMTAACFNACV